MIPLEEEHIRLLQRHHHIDQQKSIPEQTMTSNGVGRNCDPTMEDARREFAKKQKLPHHLERPKNDLLLAKAESKPVPVIYKNQPPPPPLPNHHHHQHPKLHHDKPAVQAPVIVGNSQHMLQTQAPHAAQVSAPPMQPSSHHSRGRKSRESRTRSQEWPDVPDMEKIKEDNPDLLAKKILDAGRQLEKNRENPRHPKHSEEEVRLDPKIKAPPKIHMNELPSINFNDRMQSIILSELKVNPGEQQKQQQPPPHQSLPRQSLPSTSHYPAPSKAHQYPVPQVPLGHQVNHGYPQAAPVADLKARESRRPSSDYRNPDYTQLSPAKVALRRHLSQERLSQQHPMPMHHHQQPSPHQSGEKQT